MLSRKHYEAIAEVIKCEYTRYDNTGEDDTEGKCAINSIAQKLADYFVEDNPKFNKNKFLKVCKIVYHI